MRLRLREALPDLRYVGPSDDRLRRSSRGRVGIGRFLRLRLHRKYRAPVISRHRPRGVSTALIRSLSQSAHFRTAPIGAACKIRDPTPLTRSHELHRIFASVMSGTKIRWRRRAVTLPSSKRSETLLGMVSILLTDQIVLS